MRARARARQPARRARPPPRCVTVDHAAACRGGRAVAFDHARAPAFDDAGAARFDHTDASRSPHAAVSWRGGDARAGRVGARALGQPARARCAPRPRSGAPGSIPLPATRSRRTSARWPRPTPPSPGSQRGCSSSGPPSSTGRSDRRTPPRRASSARWSSTSPSAPCAWRARRTRPSIATRRGWSRFSWRRRAWRPIPRAPHASSSTRPASPAIASANPTRPPSCSRAAWPARVSRGPPRARGLSPRRHGPT